MFSVLARHIQKYRQFHRERVKDKLKFECITACTTTLGNKHCTKYLIISSTSDQKTKILNQKDLGIFCHLKFKNGYFPSDLYIHIWQMVKIHLLEVLLPHNDLLSLIYSLHIDDLCVFSEIVVCFFSAGYFFPHILLTKVARKNGKFLSSTM